MNYKDLNLTEKELDELQDQLNMRKQKQVYEQYIEAINKNRNYIGKCFKEKNKEKYIRVLSAKSSNEYRCECMCFDFPIKYTNESFLRKIFTPDIAFGRIKFKGFYTEDYPLFCNHLISGKNMRVIDSLEEITEEEYFLKMDQYLKELQEKIKNNEFDTSKNNKSIFKK